MAQKRSRFALVVSETPSAQDMMAVNLARTAPPSLQDMITIVGGRPGTATPILVDTEAQNTATAVGDTIQVLQSMIDTARQRAASAGMAKPHPDAAAQARAALLSGGLTMGGPPQPPRPQPPSQTPAASYASQMHQSQQAQYAAHAAYGQASSKISNPAGPVGVGNPLLGIGSVGGPQVPGGFVESGGFAPLPPGYVRPAHPPDSMAAPATAAPASLNSGPGFETLASPTAGFGMPGGASSLSRSVGAPSIGMGFSQPGSPAEAAIKFTEDQSRYLLDQQFQSKGINPTIGSTPSPSAAGNMVSVEKLIPSIKDVAPEQGGPIADAGELQDKRERELADAQRRRLAAAGMLPAATEGMAYGGAGRSGGGGNYGGSLPF